MKFTVHILAAAAALMAGQAVAQGIPVYDNLTQVRLVLDSVEQARQYTALIDQYTQQLTSYSLEVQNLAALPGSLRNDVQGTVSQQIGRVTGDFGVSVGNSIMNMNTDSTSYYAALENKLAVLHGNVPSSLAGVSAALAALDITPDMSNPTYKGTVADRIKYEKVLDSYRLAGQLVNNSQKRATVSSAVSNSMKDLPANNTVGAIQLLATQNTIAYGQNEDLLKAQASLLQAEQDKEAQRLADRETLRQLGLARTARIKSELATSEPSYKPSF